MFRTCFVSSLLIFTIRSALCKSSEFVPVYTWETSPKSAEVPTSALERISEDVFKTILSDKLKTNPLVVVFVEETLSPEDFAQHDVNGKTPFLSLHELLKSSKVTYKTSVENPLVAIRDLNKPITEISVASLLRDFKIPKDDILVVDLNDAKDYEQRIDMLRRHDEIISLIMKKLSPNFDDVLGIYTGRRKSFVAPEELKRHIRSVSEEGAPTEPSIKPIVDDENLLFYLSGPAQLSEDKGKTFNPLTFSPAASTKDGNKINVTLSANGQNYDFKFVIEDAGYWSFSQMDSGATVFRFDNITVPLGFSYHCHNVSFTADSKILKLPGLQIQAFNDVKGNHSFGDAYDCVGFTSIPIWSGIFVTVLLLLILTFGITFIMDIKTMDKFDDAKGKTITINVSE